MTDNSEISSIKEKNSIGYIFSERLLNLSTKNPILKNRQKLVHSLIKSYNLLDHLEIIPSERSTYSDVRRFHSEDYCKTLRLFPNKQDVDSSNESEISDNEITADDYLSEYGLGFDCPVWFGLYDYCVEVAGSTLTACKEIIKGRRVVINWFGGWHHAQRSQAAGYCYVNDIVLGILILRQHFERVLYIDLDVHYGDGVANAFETSKKVLTLSFHQYEPGFYPGSGNTDDNGFGNGKGYSLNFPYKSGLRGDIFTKYALRLMEKTFLKFKPSAVIVQCGADCITGDPLGGSNLKPEDMARCMLKILSFAIPTVFLGGGGYHFTNTSRYWTYLTSILCNEKLSDDIPDQDKYFLEYSPGYEISIQTKNIKDLNSEEYFEELLKKLNEQLEQIEVQ